jgi:hypothetical protein
LALAPKRPLLDGSPHLPKLAALSVRAEGGIMRPTRLS